jgi:lipopolysaccharide heptosyltransferase I
MGSQIFRDTRSPRVLIVRLSAIGDTVLTMPIMNAIRDRFPQALIAWAVEERAATLLRGHPSLDELISLPRGFLHSPRTLLAVRRRLHAMRIEVALDTQGLTKSAIVAWMSGARRRIGFGGRWGREISPWINSELVYPNSLHVIDRNIELLRPLGIEHPDIRFGVPQTKAEAASAQAMVRTLDLGEKFAIINPGAGWPSKVWPFDRFAGVARYLGRNWKMPSLVVWAGAEERAWASEIVRGASEFARLAPPTSLRELASASRLAKIFVGSDTGPLHIAAAVGTPCVGLYGPWPAEETGPYGPQHVSVQKMKFPGKNSRARRHASRIYMEAIDVKSVCDACDQILHRDTTRAA